MNFEKRVLRWEDDREPYPSDVSDDEWAFFAILML
jgi:hypothetical protein